jgi:uncharacterized protein YbjT (DUF2867 family)
MKILLTGANGYIGKRLLQQLVELGHDVFCAVRDPYRLKLDDKYFSISGTIEVIQCDLLNEDSLSKLPTDIDVAYYLVHGLMQNTTTFDEFEDKMAHNFVKYLETTSCRQTIYLGGIANDSNLSKHLASRKKTEDILALARTPVTVLRAGIVIGSGSASFEIIRDLAEKLPLMVAPRWIDSKCQPIAVRDVLKYLTEVIDHPQCIGETFDIGGPEILSYKEMILQYSAYRKLNRRIYSIPFFTPKMSSYWLYFITSTSFVLAANLVNSMKNDAICDDKRILDILPHPEISYQTALELANSVILSNSVVSSWKDAFSSGVINYTYFKRKVRVPKYGCFIDRRSFEFSSNEEELVLDNIWTIGGSKGWYTANWLWKFRGFIDRLFGGVGLRRGRRNDKELTEGDAIDFWRVLVADIEGKRLLLLAEMILPGEAWLEFRIEKTDKPNVSKLVQKAIFRPKGLLGRLYWYSVLPFHGIIFPRMAKRVTFNRLSVQKS